MADDAGGTGWVPERGAGRPGAEVAWRLAREGATGPLARRVGGLDPWRTAQEGPVAARADLPGLDPAALAAVLPMFLYLGADGACRLAGPTLARICPGATRPEVRFRDLFEITRPVGLRDDPALEALAGRRLSLSLRGPPFTAFRGIMVPLAGAEPPSASASEAGSGSGSGPGSGPGGYLLNLSLGLSLAEAVRDHGLTDADFAPTDLTVDMLYLIEAKAAVMNELRGLNLRLEQAHRAAMAEAMSDPLTGLANRRGLEMALERFAADPRAVFALAHLDLDHFKTVNDTSGHAAGDSVLVEVARILREETRRQDLVARVGGDEFVLLLQDLVDPARIETLCARIIRRLEMPMRIAGEEARISGSFGVVLSGDYPAGRRGRMLQDADRALYASKGRGRARVTVFRCEQAD